MWTLSAGVPIGRRSPRKRGPYSTPKHNLHGRLTDDGQTPAVGHADTAQPSRRSALRVGRKAAADDAGRAGQLSKRQVVAYSRLAADAGRILAAMRPNDQQRFAALVAEFIELLSAWPPSSIVGFGRTPGVWAERGDLVFIGCLRGFDQGREWTSPDGSNCADAILTSLVLRTAARAVLAIYRNWHRGCGHVGAWRRQRMTSSHNPAGVVGALPSPGFPNQRNPQSSIKKLVLQHSRTPSWLSR